MYARNRLVDEHLSLIRIGKHGVAHGTELIPGRRLITSQHSYSRVRGVIASHAHSLFCQYISGQTLLLQQCGALLDELYQLLLLDTLGCASGYTWILANHYCKIQSCEVRDEIVEFLERVVELTFFGTHEQFDPCTARIMELAFVFLTSRAVAAELPMGQVYGSTFVCADRLNVADGDLLAGIYISTRNDSQFSVGIVAEMTDAPLGIGDTGMIDPGKDRIDS
ncbi:hypothetical protein F4778DRAFT_761623 [Xylariomycetidae sp. FL2044]|nr:hypothetical protein F4778DRAFT_761623 [Xylariomycetidae sp. FL2044]